MAISGMIRALGFVAVLAAAGLQGVSAACPHAELTAKSKACEAKADQKYKNSDGEDRDAKYVAKECTEACDKYNKNENNDDGKPMKDLIKEFGCAAEYDAACNPSSGASSSAVGYVVYAVCLYGLVKFF